MIEKLLVPLQAANVGQDVGILTATNISVQTAGSGRTDAFKAQPGHRALG